MSPSESVDRLLDVASKVKNLATFAPWSTEIETSAGLKSDWKPQPHLTFLADRVQARILAARAGDPRNILVIEAPPRHGKSELISKRLPAWFIARWPAKKILLSSYSADFARLWGRRARNILEAKAIELGIRVSDSQSAASDWEIEGHGGGMATTGIGGPLTGRGADLLIVDDPIKNAEEAESVVTRESHWDWWQTTASTRIEPGGCAIVMATRWNRDDLIGRILNKHPHQVERITLPAIAGFDDALGRSPGEALWPNRWPLEALDAKRGAMSRVWWEALYQQNPIAAGETEFAESWFADSWFEKWPDNLLLKVMALDPSKGRDSKRSDFQAVIKLGIGADDCLYVQADLKRRPIPQMVADVVQIYRDFQPHGFCLESNAWQDLLAPDFAEEFTRQDVLAPEVFQISNQVNKLVRIRRLAGYMPKGRMRFKSDCPDTKILIDQLIDFPNGTFDDGPDALEMAVRLAEQLTAG